MERIKSFQINHNILEPGFYISREDDRATLGIEPIRLIKEDISYYPNDGDFKVYIIEDAHTMTPQAQNAFLLTLEDPPKYAVFILLCENTETILETIKSRAPILRMKTPSKNEAMDYIKEKDLAARNFINNSTEEFEQIYMASNGSIGRILELISSGERNQILQNRELTLKFIESIANHTLSSSFAEISAMFSQKRDEREKIIAQLSQIQCALRDIMVIKKFSKSLWCDRTEQSLFLLRQCLEVPLPSLSTAFALGNFIKWLL